MAGRTACLAHLDDAGRGAYLAGLSPGAGVDHRGTTFTQPLLDALLGALRDPGTGQARFGDALFDSATFEGDAWFGSAVFEGDVRFRSATFEGIALFDSATFKGGAEFGAAAFGSIALFHSVVFEGDARFGSVTFEGDTWFQSATFRSDAWFRSATFQGDTGFESAIFESDALFESVTFQNAARFRSATFRSRARFGLATFRGVAGFGSVTFESDAGFRSAVFKSVARFSSATFEGVALFGSAVFKRDGAFESAAFKGGAGFESAVFENRALFESVTFESDVRFTSATFKDDAGFESVTFRGDARFESATFESDARFTGAAFERASHLGPLVCAGRVTLSGAVFGGPVSLAFAARRLECRRTRWSSTAELRLRHTTVDFAHAVFEYPLTIAAELDPFVLSDGRQVGEEPVFGASDAAVHITSLRGVDAAHLVLADVGLAECLFTGTVHLDQIRLEGTCSFATVPSRARGRAGHPVRFTRRRVLAEEHHWRANRPTAVPGWNGAVPGAGQVGPAQLAPVYRALRKALEDSKNEPGAADFYYGEMEMRRHDRTGTTRAERGLLYGYWLLSGYGLRASRALGWLAAALLVTIVLLMGFGLPGDNPGQEATGTVPSGGGRVTFAIGKDDPRNPTGARFTGERFEKALNVTLNSVVFRSSGQDLTTAGTYIEMASRLTEPVLLALAVLAVRNRVKR
ncbi:pentapeptide repeat-containing protein [Streptomyces sp. NPDC087420]|uniref:pentapeptide repeat-containing protein n=1 Tax=Streptomyces sp. NPDC087420 TaxID=3365785 RepID=UPI0038345E31